MKKARFRVMAGLAGATLCLFAVTTYAQNTNTTTGTTPDQSAQSAAPPTTTQPSTPTGDAATPAPPAADANTSNGTITTTATDVATTDTTTRSFPGGFWGILAVAVVVLLVLFGLFRGKDRTVVKDTYVTTNPTPNTRSSGMGTTASGDRVITQRVASGTETTTTRVNDPNARS